MRGDEQEREREKNKVMKREREREKNKVMRKERERGKQIKEEVMG